MENQEAAPNGEEYTEQVVDNGAESAEVVPEVQTEEAEPQSHAEVCTDDEEQRKIFVGGLSWETDADSLREYFEKFGEVVDCNLKTDLVTGRSRGFGFVTFAAAECVTDVLNHKNHSLHNRKIDPKKAMPRGTQEPVKKIFVGGLDTDVPEKTIREHFSKFGTVEEIDLPFDKIRNQRRQFCFITFESESAVESAINEPSQTMPGGKQVDIKRATPKGTDGQGRNRGYQGNWGEQGYNQGWGPGYDYYNHGGYGYDYYNQGGYGGYDYSNYYGQGWGQGYGQGYGGGGYGGGYDYSSWYGPNQQQTPPSGTSEYPPPEGQSGGAQGNFKTKSAPGSAPGYHPYQR